MSGCPILECCDDLVIKAGDDESPIIDVVDCNGAAVDISSVLEISFSILVSPTLSVVKTKTGGGIILVGTAPQGSFQVNLLPADTRTLSGWYSYKAVLTDYAGNISTVRQGYVEIKP